MIQKLYIDDREVEIATSIGTQCGDYTVYNNKIWRIVGSQGIYKRLSRCLEREDHEERIWVYGPEKLPLVVKPTGYIRI